MEKFSMVTGIIDIIIIIGTTIVDIYIIFVVIIIIKIISSNICLLYFSATIG